MEECKCSMQVRSLGVRRGKDLILHDVNLDVHHGEIMALIGRNGAGKTTLLKALLGRVSHTGSVRFFNHSGEEVLKPKIGYVPQSMAFDRDMPITVGDMLCAGLSEFPVWMGHKKNARLQAEEMLLKAGGKNLWEKQLGNLSGGELQRVLLSFALYPTPDLLLLDEPVSAVDNKGIEAFYEIVLGLRKDYHMPVILISHNLLHVKKYATAVTLLDRTVIKSGTVQEVMNSEEVKETFGVF